MVGHGATLSEAATSRASSGTSGTSMAIWQMEFTNSSNMSRLKHIRLLIFAWNHMILHDRSHAYYNMIYLLQCFSICFALPFFVIENSSLSVSELSDTQQYASLAALTAIFIVAIVFLFLVATKYLANKVPRAIFWFASFVFVPAFYIVIYPLVFVVATFSANFFSSLLDGNPAAALPLLLGTLPAAAATTVFFACMNMCMIHTELLNISLLSASTSLGTLLSSVCNVIALVIRATSSTLSQNDTHWALGCYIAGLLIILGALVLSVEQQYVRMASNCVYALVASMVGGAITLGNSPSIGQYVIFVAVPLVCVICFWPFLAAQAMFPFYKAVAAHSDALDDHMRVDPDPHGDPSPAGLPPFAGRVPHMPTSVLAIGMRAYIARVHGVIKHKIAAAKRAREPVALPGFGGSDQFIAPEEQQQVVDRIIESTREQRVLFRMYQRALASRPNSSDLMVQYGLLVNALQPRHVTFALAMLDKLASAGALSYWRLDVGFVIYSLFQSSSDSFRGAAHAAAKERHARAKKLGEVRGSMATMLDARRALWAMVSQEHSKVISMAKLARMTKLFAQVYDLTHTIEKGFRDLLPAASPHVLREYASFVDRGLGRAAEAQTFLTMADELETSGRGRQSVFVEPVLTRKAVSNRRLVGGSIELRTLAGTGALLLLLVGAIGAIYLVEVYSVERVVYVAHATSRLAAALNLVHIGALQFTRFEDIQLLTAGAFVAHQSVMAPLYTLSKADVSSLLGVVSKVDVFATAQFTNSVDFFTKLATMMEAGDISFMPRSDMLSVYSVDSLAHSLTSHMATYLRHIETTMVNDTVSNVTLITTMLSQLNNYIYASVSVVQGNADSLMTSPDPDGWTGIMPVGSLSLLGSGVKLTDDVDAVLDTMDELYEHVFYTARDFPMFASNVTAIAVLLLCAGMVYNVCFCFFLPVLMETSQALSLLKLVFAMPGCVIHAMAHSRDNRPDTPCSNAPATPSRLHDIEMDDDALVDAETLQTNLALHEQSTVVRAAPTEEPDVGQKRWAAIRAGMVAGRLLALAPRTLAWVVAVGAVLVSVFAASSYSIETVAFFAQYNYVLSSIERTALKAYAVTYRLAAVEADTLVEQTDDRAALQAHIADLRRALGYLTLQGDTEADWLPTSDPSMLAPLVELITKFGRGLVAPTWSSNTNEDAIAAVLYESACRVHPDALAACPPELGGSADLPVGTTDGLISSLSLYITRLNALIDYPVGAADFDYLNTTGMVVMVGIEPCLREIGELMVEAQGELVIMAYASAIAAGVVVTVLVALMHFLHIRRVIWTTLRGRVDVLVQLDFVLNRHRASLGHGLLQQLKGLQSKEALDELVEADVDERR
ncbi:hypothetical protein J8273_7534 [Carpediemonas membranifera]|uniref:Uncharacterized protein n=1 Tax=Carpediemonas membranifera TaxID=201153 RepID=A0A8J6ATR2_9EUKA|nr:hypothetical protein J8273_7534 [Carpediemonas membranifera]|eukprot:KAG9391260.1 hypothetical protein J8273_7534 [Carpediemonas membranifera]